LKLHEYQAKNLLNQTNLPIPRGSVCSSPEEAVEIANAMPQTQGWVIKAQIHAGGRGKGGGIQIAKSLEDVDAAAKMLIGKMLVTPQTGPDGTLVRKILVEEAITIINEIYVGVTVNRNTQNIVFIASVEGGTDIEEVAVNNPDSIHTLEVDTSNGVDNLAVQQLAKNLLLSESKLPEFFSLLSNLYDIFIDIDATLIEINPLAIVENGEFMVADCKIIIDDSALYRQPKMESLRDLHEEDPVERAASDSGLSYIALGGDIGCLVNGAGLAMATMDIIKLHGGNPANFLDVGGGATVGQVTHALELMLKQGGIKIILVNIFGGIMQCDVIASGIVNAVKAIDLKLPFVVRLEGTNVKEGQQILRSSGIDFVLATTMDEAAKLTINSIDI
tara:strand:- start:4308 stop:5474 length:1167 start_codon:yes stop_codon:yes gene_type:complete